MLNHWLTAAAWTSAFLLMPQSIQPFQPLSAVQGFLEEVGMRHSANSPNSSNSLNLSNSLHRANNPVVAQNIEGSEAALENAIFQQINQYRQQNGLPVLSSNPAIAQQARQHSQNMAKSRALSHVGFNVRVSAIGESISYRSAAENVAYNMGYDAPDRQAVEGWVKSTGHRQNIEGNYNLTGIGVAQNAQGEWYFTQIFIQR